MKRVYLFEARPRTVGWAWNIFLQDSMEYNFSRRRALIYTCCCVKKVSPSNPPPLAALCSLHSHAPLDPKFTIQSLQERPYSRQKRNGHHFINSFGAWYSFNIIKMALAPAFKKSPCCEMCLLNNPHRHNSHVSMGSNFPFFLFRTSPFFIFLGKLSIHLPTEREGGEYNNRRAKVTHFARESSWPNNFVIPECSKTAFQAMQQACTRPRRAA